MSAGFLCHDPRMAGERGELWVVERIEHAELPLWIAVSYASAEVEELMAVSFAQRREGLERYAEARGARLQMPTTGGSSCGSQAKIQLLEYLAGERRCFELHYNAVGTDFEQLAWQALGEIPYGETRSYGAQAHSMDRPGAQRAVGRANGKNPLPIVIPCHRVRAYDGSLGGFSGGLSAKRWLLALESAQGQLCS